MPRINDLGNATVEESDLRLGADPECKWLISIIVGSSEEKKRIQAGCKGCF